ncbi:MAG: glycosyltransferase [Candidatus Babeliales bacterium]
MLTIFHITNNYKPYSGGVARAVDAWYQVLKKRGHQTYIITLDFLGKELDEDSGIIRVPTIARFLYKKNYAAIPFKATQVIEKLVQEKKPDIIHVHHPFLLGNIGKKVAKKYNIPVVFTYHTQYERYLHYVPIPEKISYPLVTRQVKQFCNAVNGVIAPSLTIKKQIEEQIKKPIIVIPSPIEDIFFGNIKQKVFKQKTKLFHLITVSRFVPEKNIPFLLRAIKMIADEVQCTLIGYGSDAEELQRYAYNELLLCPQRVRFVIKPSREELLQYYQSADLFIFASETETQGLVLAEAMASGLPVIAVDAPGCKDIIQSNINGYLIDNEQEMIEHILKLKRDQIIFDKLSGNAIVTAQQFCSDVLVEKMESYYQTILKM